MAKYFISYRRRESDDSRLAATLRDGLIRAGHEVFVDTELTIGEDWVAEIERALQWCDFLVVLLSAGSVQSEMVQGEIRRAHRLRGRNGRPSILPVRVRFDDQLNYELDSYLARSQYVRWTSSADDATLLKAIAESKLLPASAPTAVPVPRETSISRSDRPPVPSPDKRLLRQPGGTLAFDDVSYIPRRPDDLVEGAAVEGRSTIIIKGPSQVGKSSLLMRYLAAASNAGRRFVLIDFQILSYEDLGEHASVLTFIARQIARQLGLPTEPPERIASQEKLGDYIESVVLPSATTPIVLAFDEVDRVLGHSYQVDFFSMLRVWHNSRGRPFSDWKRVDLALVISTEPYLLIDVADRSPFNVTPAIELESFERDALERMNAQFGSPLADGDLDTLLELLGGNPYLTRLAFYRMFVHPRCSLDELWRDAAENDGPFGEHLRAKLFWLARKPGLLPAMRRVIEHGTVQDEDTFVRLRGAGLVKSEGRRYSPTNLLYARFFQGVR